VEEKLATCMARSLRTYIDDLQGEKPSNLYESTLTIMERELFTFTIGECRGNLSEAARMLGISRTTLSRKIARYQITRKKPRQ
jgi:DNA-binding protein Fis